MNDEVYALLASSILFNAALAPIMVKLLYDPSKKYIGCQARSIMSLKPQSEIRILSCIYRPDTISSILRLLEASYPTKESPIDVYAQHIMELVGQSRPVFIAHERNKRISDPCSQNVILAFNQYEQYNYNAVSVHTFTAISPANLMYEDIYTLAVDKIISLILIPLHRKWSAHGFIESENQTLRILIRNVLQKAPCTVGIFFERSKLINNNNKVVTNRLTSKWSFLSLCMIFLGGMDDREALTLAKRMANNSMASLTIMHLITDHKDEEYSEFEEKLLDNKLLESLKKISETNENISYKEQLVNDGPQTALLVHSLANEFDLFLVGRRYGVESPQTIGLAEWNELPELGIIGDLLASRDINTGASVLVVQQQQTQVKHIS